MLPLSRSDLLLPEFPPFMLDGLEVVNSPAESPKCVSTRNEQELKAPIQNCRNQTVQFHEQDTSVLSRPVAIRGTVGLR
jgi:hypothetical protein